MSNFIEPLENRLLLTVLTFEKLPTATATTPTTLSVTDLTAGYGDRVNGATQNAVSPATGVWKYGTTEGPTPKIVASYGPKPTPTSSPQLGGWGTAYGDLVNVLYGTTGKIEITLSADSGYLTRLHSFDLGGWANADYTVKSVQVFSGANKVYESLNRKVEGDFTGVRHTTVSFATPLVGQSLRILIDATNAGGGGANIGIDNVRFSQAAAAGAIELTGGVLKLTGTENAEALSVTKTGTNLIAKVGASLTKTYAESSVTSISVDAKGGNDNVSITTTTTKPTTLLGGAGNDTILGGGGPDRIEGGTGADRMGGGLGNDTVDYGARTSSVFVFLDGLPNDGGNGEKDNVLTDIETIIGGSAGDVLYGNASANKLFGNGGNDYLFGGGNNDTVDGGSGDDQIMGGDGNDSLTGGAGLDQIFGEAGDDSLFSKDSLVDLLDGGIGNDKAQRDAIDSVLNIESFIA